MYAVKRRLINGKHESKQSAVPIYASGGIWNLKVSQDIDILIVAVAQTIVVLQLRVSVALGLNLAHVDSVPLGIPSL